MAGLGDIVGSIVPQFEGIGVGSLVGIITYLVLLVLIIVIGAVLTWFVVKRKKYRNKIIIFEKIDGKMTRTGTDRAMEMKYGQSGDTIFLTSKSKRYLPRPTIQTGAREFWYYIREDGELINFGIEDIDANMKKAKVHYLDKEVRYARTQIQRNLKERFDKKSWIAENWTVVAGIGFVAMIGIMTWLLFDKWIDLAGATNSGVDAARLVLEEAKKVVASLDNICTGGSGLLPAS